MSYPYDNSDYPYYYENLSEIYGSYPNFGTLQHKVENYEVYAFGVVWSVLVICTVFSNAFVMYFFLQQNRRYKSSNVIFVSIAVSDTLTGLVNLPLSLYVYAGRNTNISPELCQSVMMLRFYVSRVFHTVSTWQTVLMAVHRYLCVCHPFTSAKWTTVRKTLLGILAIYILSLVVHVYIVQQRFDEYANCVWSVEMPCHETCIYLWISAFVCHVVPCSIMLIMTLLLLSGLKTASGLVSNMSHVQSARESRDRRITQAVGIVVIVMLLPELPHAIYKLVYVNGIHSNTHILDHNDTHIIMCVYELLLVLSVFANFFIYSFLIKDFRKVFIALFDWKAAKARLTRFRSFSTESKSSLSGRRSWRRRSTEIFQSTSLQTRFKTGDSTGACPRDTQGSGGEDDVFV